jgi:hypothetical protein
MAEQPTLHIDTDWKKQAQEEKRKLAEEEQKRAAAAATPAAPAGGGKPGTPAAGKRGWRDLPVASFATLVQGFVTQALYYMGGLAMQGGEPNVNLDMAKLQLDTLTLLEEKTKNNLTPEEQKMLDEAMYEVQMRYVAIASEYI